MLVRFCASAWCRHLARLLPPSTVEGALSAFDAAIARCVAAIAGERGAQLQMRDFVRARLLLPGRLGGGGVGTAEIAPAGYAASVASSRAFFSKSLAAASEEAASGDAADFASHAAADAEEEARLEAAEAGALLRQNRVMGRGLEHTRIRACGIRTGNARG